MTSDPLSTENVMMGEQAIGADKLQQSERFQAIGQRLKDAREGKSLSRSEVASQLHLPTQLLDDLEAGRMERLAPIYRRGYITNYATLLKIDQAELTSGLDNDPPPALTTVLPVKRPRFRFERYIKFATYLVATIAIVPPLIMVYLNTGVGLFNSEKPESEVTRTEIMPLTATETDEASFDRTSTEDRQRPVTASALPLSSIRPLSAADASSANTEPEVTIEPTQPDPLSDAPIAMLLTLRLKEDSWVEISAGDDQRLEYDLLRANQELTYEGLPPLNILLGRAKAVDLILDGELVVFDGHDRGDVAELTINRDGTIQR